MLIDSHVHLDSKDFTDDIIDVIKNAESNGVYSMINAAVDMRSSIDGIRLSEKNAGVWAAVGIHPHDAKTFDNNTIRTLRKLASHPKVVAIGEIGLDFYRDYSPHDIQRVVFRAQLNLAKELDMPVILHIRAAHEEAMTILEDEWQPGLKGILHSFSGDINEAKWGIEHGFYIGINGAITFKNFKNAELIRSIPLEKMVVETDCPYITPEPHRGKRNEPAYVKYTALKLSEILDKPLKKVEETTTRNVCRVFGLPDPPKPSLSLFPQRGLSQNYLTDDNIARKIIDKLNPAKSVVIEIGPGKGILTKHLAKSARKTYAVELDYDLAKELAGFGWENTVVVHQDFLKFDIGGVFLYEGDKPQVVGNIPYRITSPIVFKLVESRESISKAVLMMQREVGQRLVAQPGSKKYGIPSILVQLYFDLEIEFHVSSNAFFPKPKVASVVVSMVPLDKPRFQVKDYEFFKNLIRGAFNQRRKLLYNALSESPFMDIDKDILKVAFDKVGLSREVRPGKVSLEKYVELAIALSI
ncbi:ribosomal RNA small subunit methyltransferase A [bacterium]|nr:ribosomal RNA small subunit methyltransferase A [bacterium]